MTSLRSVSHFSNSLLFGSHMDHILIILTLPTFSVFVMGSLVIFDIAILFLAPWNVPKDSKFQRKMCVQNDPLTSRFFTIPSLHRPPQYLRNNNIEIKLINNSKMFKWKWQLHISYYKSKARDAGKRLVEWLGLLWWDLGPISECLCLTPGYAPNFSFLIIQRLGGSNGGSIIGLLSELPLVLL